MKFGLTIFPTDYAINPIILAQEAEARGFESIFLPEHTHIPVNRETPFPGGGDLPKEYSHTFDPFITLGAIAASTKNIKLATGIALIVERDPIILAKEISTLDIISKGRVLLGVGGGWNREEMRNHGTSPERRWKLMRERIEAMKNIWTQNVAEYHGEFVNFDPLWQWPKPLQKPHPPIIVGGNGANTLKRVIRYGDEWMPIGNRGEYLNRIPELQELALESGRNTIPISVFGASSDEKSIIELASAGVDRAILRLKSAEKEQILPVLDQYASIIETFSN